MKLKQKILMVNLVVGGLVATAGCITALGIYRTQAVLLGVLAVACAASVCSGVIGWVWISKFINNAECAVKKTAECEQDVNSQEFEVIEILEPVKKLADKLTQLSQKVLEQEKADAAKLQTTSTPEGHTKEISCLYSLSRLMEQMEIQLDEVFQKAVHLIQRSYQFPGEMSVRITYEGVQYKSEDFRKSEISQYAQIDYAGEKAGSIEVYYIAERPKDRSSVFLEDEGHLLKAAAGQLGTIAEVKKSNDKLRLFRNLMDRSNDCVYVVEPQWGRFLYVNDRLCQALGYSRLELLEMTIENIELPDVSGASVKERLNQVKEQGQVVLENHQRRKDSSVYIAETSLKYVGQGNREYIIGISRDITERTRAQEMQARLLREVKSANKELTDFAHVVSHDLKAPLRGIRTLAEWVIRDCADKLDEDGKENLHLLNARAERMHNLINGILQYSRLGRVKEEKVAIDLNELIPEIIDMLAIEENMEVSVEDKLPVINADETRIAQVFQNLLSNAVKYMDKPQGVVRIGCIEDDGFWRFSVSDNGPGIEEKDFDRVFKMFQTLGAGDEYESTGVGLTLVKKIVELYGGRIWVESEPGTGSTFVFTLPKRMGVKHEKFEANIACGG